MFESEGIAALRSLRGQLLQIPDLRPVYAGWAAGLNPHCDELRTFVDEKIDRYVIDEKARLKTKAIDLGWFTSLYVLVLSSAPSPRLPLTTLRALGVTQVQELSS